MRKGVVFEWDEAKRQANLEKHGIDFAALGPAFADPQARLLTDRRQDYGEERLIMIAAWDGLILTIVFTRRPEAIRLVSARLASRKEREFHAR